MCVFVFKWFGLTDSVTPDDRALESRGNLRQSCRVLSVRRSIAGGTVLQSPVRVPPCRCVVCVCVCVFVCVVVVAPRGTEELWQLHGTVHLWWLPGSPGSQRKTTINNLHYHVSPVGWIHIFLPSCLLPPPPPLLPAYWLTPLLFLPRPSACQEKRWRPSIPSLLM